MLVHLVLKVGHDMLLKECSVSVDPFRLPKTGIFWGGVGWVWGLWYPVLFDLSMGNLAGKYPGEQDRRC